MRFVDEFRDPALVQALVERIRQVCKGRVRLMEICGSHTVAVARSGLYTLLPAEVELISGPGCPVCVTPSGVVALVVRLAQIPGVVLASFGDMLAVPSRLGSLKEARAQGAKVQVVYSPMDALHLAAGSPKEQVVFLGVGFETTAPGVAATLLSARKQGVRNFSVLCLLKTIPPALRALLAAADVRIDGFLCPGHVSTIIGAGAYGFVAREFGRPAVIAGFEPVDILQGIWRLVEQCAAGEARVEIAYRRAVSEVGNLRAQQLIYEVFEPVDAAWRGLGWIPGSGLRLREEWGEFDALRRFGVSVARDDVMQDDLLEDCACGEVLRGVLLPPECPLFAGSCTPQTPVGPCMVSSEGSCAAYYRYRRG